MRQRELADDMWRGRLADPASKLFQEIFVAGAKLHELKWASKFTKRKGSNPSLCGALVWSIDISRVFYDIGYVRGINLDVSCGKYNLNRKTGGV